MDRQPSLLGPSSRSWQVRALLIMLVGLSFALRAYDLEGKSLWSDEGLTLRRAEQPLVTILENVNLIPIDPDYQDGSGPKEFVKTPDLHPPLYFLLMHFWIQLAGKSEFALRFPSVIAATAAVPLFYVLGRSLFSRETGLWAALLGAASPFYLWYAQEARMYTWLVVFSLGSVYLLRALLKEQPRHRQYMAFIAVTLGLVYTHYAGFLLLACEMLIYLAYRIRRHRRQTLIVLAALVLAALPLAPFMLGLIHVQPFSFTYRPLPAILREAWSSFSLGPTRSAVQPWWRLLPFLALTGAGALMLHVPRRRRAWAFGLGYLALPIMIQYALSLLKPNYMNPRHLMVAAPAWELLLAKGLTTLRRSFSPSAWFILGLILLLRGEVSHDILTSHDFWKDDIRGAAQYIEERARPGDAIVLHHPVIRLTFDYYYDGDCPEIAIPRYGNNQDTDQAQATLAEWARRYHRIWFLYGPPPTYFPHDFLPNWSDTHLFKIREQVFEAWWTYVGVAAYMQDPPTSSSLPTGIEPSYESWDGLRLVGLSKEPAAAGERAWLDFYWQPQGELPEEALNLKVQLRDEAGTVWYERSADVLPLYPTSAWPSDQIVHTGFRLQLPQAIPPISYSLTLQPMGLGDPRAITNVQISRSATSDPPPRPIARFEGGIALLAGDLDSDTFQSGHPLTGALTWRAHDAPQEDYQLRIRLVDQHGQQVTSNQMLLSAAGFPTSAWMQDDRAAGRLVLPLPADLKSGRYRVEISLVSTRDDHILSVRRWYGRRQWFTLGTVRVEVLPLVTEPPATLQHRLSDIHIAQKVRLRGYDLARDGDTLSVTLYWQAEDTLDENYHVFVHVGEAGQPPRAEAGGVPADWTRPTRSWRKDEVIVDEHTLSLNNVPSGRYDLLVGFYEPETQQRPETTVKGQTIDGGYILLQEVDVE